MPEQNRPQIKDERTLHEVVSGILQEKEPEVYESSGYQNTGFLWYSITYAMDKSGQEARRDIAGALIGFCNANNLDAEVADMVFKRYSTEEERTKPIDEEGNVYCADLDVTINPGRIYDASMENEDFIGAMTVAQNYGLGKDKENAARIKYVEQKIRSDEPKNINTLRMRFDSIERSGALDTAIGKEVAKLWYDCLLANGRGLGKMGFHDAEYFVEAAQVAQKAGLGEDLVKQAEAEKPGFLKRAYTAVKRFVLYG